MNRSRARTKDYAEVVENIEIAWIGLSDGRRLAARVVHPREAEAHPVPAILEYIPYRRRDGTRARDEETMPWFAAHGYAYARVDISGSGDSDGLIEDEYVRREQDDALEIIAWLAAQPWCSGAVGMIGISWGGFNALQVAALRPPALKAVISVCSTVDRYHDDVHFMGGCLLWDNLDWGAAFFTFGALPPDPQIVGQRRWRTMWRDRLEQLELYPALWLAHQRRDGFWRHGSVIENYDAIEVPVLAVSGWADGYTAAVFRLVENLNVPSKGIVGPWGHKYPHLGVPGPAIDFLNECKRWWDRWLKGVANGAENDPALRLYLQDAAVPRPHHDHRDGRWLGLKKWPHPAIRTERLHFTADGLAKRPARRSAKQLRSVCSPQTTGLAAGEWCAYALGNLAPELTFDQREDDAGSMLFDSEVLARELRIVGRTKVQLRLSCNEPQALIAVRLNDVHPDGTVARLSFGLLNLSHRESHAKPTRLQRGRFYDVTVELNEAAQSVPAGHRLRIAISTSYWPMVWPSPQPATVTVDAAGSWVDVPVLRSESSLAPVTFGPPCYAKPLAVTVKEPVVEAREVCRDIESGRTRFIVTRDDGRYVIEDIGTELHYAKQKAFSILPDDPTSAEQTVDCQAHFRRGKWDARVAVKTTMTADEKHFYLNASVRAFDRGRVFLERDFRHRFARDNI
ncbi:MAG: CocE/NonD family hydrolase [Gammaproteobacteria bacterium]